MLLVDGRLEPGRLPLVKMAAGEVLTLSMRKALPSSLPPPIPHWGVGQGKASTCAVKVEMVQGEMLDQRSLSV